MAAHFALTAPHRRCIRKLHRLLASLAHAVMVALLLALPAAAADETVTLNFVNADIEAVVKAVAEMTGRNFIIDPKIKGTVNIISARPVPKSLVYPTLLSALRMQGVAAVEGNGITKLVLEADAKMHGSAVGSGNVAAGGDRLVTQVIALRNESAQQLVSVLRPLISPNNTIAAYPGSNALIITDYAENLRRIEKIIASLDQPPAGEPLLVTLKNASAIDLVPLLNRLLGAETAVGAAGGQPADAQQRVTVVADPRSNSILLRSENPARAARARTLIEQLDTPGRPGGNMFIVYLKNADAARVAQTVRALLSGGSDAGTISTAGPSVIGNQLGSATAANAGSGNVSGSSASSPTPTANNANPFSGGSNSGGAMSGGLSIQADVANNALIIMGPEPLYNNLRAVIEKLDVRRAQVFVEALIVEVAADRAAEFGIQWQILQGIDKTNVQGFGGTNFGTRDSGNNIIAGSINISALGQGLNLGVIDGTVSIPGFGRITNLGFLARALETDAGANILSTPTLLTLDNEEARIIVGQNVPIVTGQFTTPGSLSTQPFQTFDRRDIGVMLRVKPQITEGGSIRLSIYQEVSRIESFTTTTGLVLSKRALESSVIVDDQQVAVLGGLIQDSFADGSDRVPVLGSIPGIGALFRYDARKRQKVNLMIFLKPTVVRTDAQGRDLTSERYDYIKGEQDKSRPQDRYFWQDRTVPTLPPKGVMPGTPEGNLPSVTAPPREPAPLL